MYGLFEAEVEGIADESVADADLVCPWNLLVEEGEVLEAEVVTGVEAKAAGPGCFCSMDEGGDGSDAVLFIACCVGLGVELHAVGSGTGCVFHHFFVGVHEDADADAGFTEAGCHVGQEVEVGLCVPSVVAGDLIMSVRHQGDLCGTVLKDEGDEFRDGIAFDVELCCEQWFQIAHILIADVSLVGPWMNRDTLCTKAFAVLRHLQDIGIVAASRIADSGHFIDIYAEFRWHNSVIIVCVSAAKIVILW